MSQTVGMIYLNGRLHGVLVRDAKDGRYIKLAEKPVYKAGVSLEDEQAYLNENQNLIDELLNGKTVKL